MGFDIFVDKVQKTVDKVFDHLTKTTDAKIDNVKNGILPDVQNTKTAVTNLSNKIGVNGDSGTTTVMGKLNKIDKATEGSGQKFLSLSEKVSYKRQGDLKPDVPIEILNVTGSGLLNQLLIDMNTYQFADVNVFIDGIQFVGNLSSDDGHIYKNTPFYFNKSLKLTITPSSIGSINECSAWLYLYK